MASGAGRSANTSDRWACSSRRRRQLNRYGMHNLVITLAKINVLCACAAHGLPPLQAATSSGSGDSHSEEQRVSQRRAGAHMELAPLPSFSVCSLCNPKLACLLQASPANFGVTMQGVWGTQDDHHESGSDLSEEENSDAVSGPPSRPADEQPSISCSEDEEAKGTAQGAVAVCHTPATGPAVAREQARPASAESGPSGSMPGSRKRNSVQDCEVSESDAEPHGGSKRRSLGRASPSDEAIASDATLQAAASPLAPRYGQADVTSLIYT